MKDFFRARRPHRGLTYEAYLAAWEAAMEAPVPDGATPRDRRRRHYLRYNRARTRSVHAAYEPSARLNEVLAAVEAPQLWMVLTESWCGDSAFCLPVLVEAARRTPEADLRILRRDDNLEVMDQYLTRGSSRSIPKLVVFAEDGTELFAWGPRPAGAQVLYDRLAREGMAKRQIVVRLVEWYASGGWQDVDAELATAMAAI